VVGRHQEMISTPWLYDTATVSTLDVPVRWSVITYPDPSDDGEPEPEDDWTADE
jgi:hypothetical protein